VDTEEVVHTYLKEGTYNVTLTVRVSDGPESEAATIRLDVSTGDKTSDEDLPGTGGAMGAMAIILASLLAMALSRRDRMGDGPP
jgi:hypothetical protein